MNYDMPDIDDDVEFKNSMIRALELGQPDFTSDDVRFLENWIRSTRRALFVIYAASSGYMKLSIKGGIVSADVTRDGKNRLAQLERKHGT